MTRRPRLHGYGEPRARLLLPLSPPACLWLAFPTPTSGRSPRSASPCSRRGPGRRGRPPRLPAGTGRRPGLLRARRCRGRASTSARCPGSPSRRWRPSTSGCRPGRALRAADAAGGTAPTASSFALRLGRGRRACAPARPTAASRGRELAFSQADTPLAPRRPLAERPVGFVIALTGPCSPRGPARPAAFGAHRRAAAVAGPRCVCRGVGRPPSSPLRSCWPSRGSRCALPTDGPTAPVPRPSRATCPGRARLQRRAPAGPRQPRRGDPQALERRRAGRAPAPTSSSGPRTPPTSTPCATPTPRPSSSRPSTRCGVPLIVGGLLDEPAGFVSNVSLLFEPGKGDTDRYVKRHPVPFAEYIPNRSFCRIFSTEVDLVRADFVAGPAPGVFRVTSAPGSRSGRGLDHLLRGRLRRPRA